jgi:hypothetical protein
MASTLTAANLVVTIKESITLNGQDQGAENTLTISSVNEITKRIVTVPTSEVIIFAFGTAVGKGQQIESDVRYIRITNKDDTNHAGIVFRNEDDDEFSVKLDKGQSFIYNADLSGGVVDTFDATEAKGVTPNTFADLVDITAIADTAAVDLEVFIANA